MRRSLEVQPESSTLRSKRNKRHQNKSYKRIHNVVNDVDK